jgi:hypothetical protein
MLVRRCMRWAVAAAGLTAGQTVLMPILRAQAGTTAAAAPAANAPTATAPPSVCGSTPNCAESSDFAAMITNFRTSDLRGYKMLDVIVRFRNKTANPLVLGYVQGSGGAVDEKGNRYSVYGGNGVRGIGQVSGNSFDPKFTLPPGGVGDAQFELAWYPGQEIYGFTFMLDLTVDEINSYQGNQHSLGGEFPLHFEGLTNGVSSGAALAAGGGVPGGSPCNQGGAAGTAMNVAAATGSGAVQNAAGHASSTAATAATTVSSITSLFHHKKAAAQPAGQTVDPCASTTNAAVAHSAPSASPGPAVATSTSAGSIASKNPAPATNRQGATAAAPTSISATSPGTKTVVGTVKAQPGTSVTVARAPVGTPAATTSRTVTPAKSVTTVKKDTTITRSKP